MSLLEPLPGIIGSVVRFLRACHEQPALWALLALVVATAPRDACARPEYAVKQKLTCTQCHILPTGGGPRTVFGKSYGSHSFVPALTSNTDLYYGDFRSELYYPTHDTTKQYNGLFLMTVAPAVHVKVLRDIQDPANGPSVDTLLSVDFSPLTTSVREADLIWRPAKNSSPWVPSTFVFGRFYIPFGLMTDEHRTYTRMFVPTTIRDFEMGGLFSWDFPAEIHADIALTNGFLSGGNLTNNDLTFATIGNLRWNPASLPFLIGTSASYHRSVSQSPSPYAFAAYGVLSLARLTQGAITATIQGEWELARYWTDAGRNPRLSFFFPQSAAAFAATLADSQGDATYVEALYDFSEKFSLTYQLNYVNFDRGAENDSFFRNGFGFRWHAASNLTLYGRYEFADDGPAIPQTALARATQDVIFAMLRFWL